LSRIVPTVAVRSNIKDVAKLAGVSIATVSRVFNEGSVVRPTTRQRVLDVAAKLKYTPSAAARGLIMKRTEAIGLLLPDLHGEFFSEIIRGADAAAQGHQYHLIVSSSHNDPSEIAAALRFMRGRVDGLVIMSPQVHSDLLLANLPKSLPVVLLNCRIESTAYDTIIVDGFRGARQMVSHLVALGHRRIAIIKGEETNREAQERLRGYRAALAAVGIPREPASEFDGDFTESSGYEAALRILTAHPRPTAVFASNDAMAIGAIGAFHERGLEIPEQISVCGFDDIPIAKYLRPALTSVHVPIRDLGFMSIGLALKRLRPRRKQNKPSRVLVATEIAERASCAPPLEADSAVMLRGAAGRRTATAGRSAR
jgi:LacI family transcriptional regulator